MDKRIIGRRAVQPAMLIQSLLGHLISDGEHMGYGTAFHSSLLLAAPPMPGQLPRRHHFFSPFLQCHHCFRQTVEMEGKKKKNHREIHCIYCPSSVLFRELGFCFRTAISCTTRICCLLGEPETQTRPHQIHKCQVSCSI